MQAAVDIVNTSTHPTNKIAASIFGQDAHGAPFLHTRINHWPDPIAQHFGTTTPIGNCSGSVHAETTCLLATPTTNGASLCITDPFCPNCAKNMAEAGITQIYIDHKGFEKDFAQRRGPDFASMSLRIVERAGIAVHVINRKGQTVTPLIAIPTPDTTTSEDNPPHFFPLRVTDAITAQESLITTARNFTPSIPHLPYATAIVTAPHHPARILVVESHVSPGYHEASHADRAEMDRLQQGKYSFVLEPVNRLIFTAHRHGLTLDPRLIATSRIPTSREQVNMVAAHLTSIHVLNPSDSRDVHSLNALHQLTQAGIMRLVT